MPATEQAAATVAPKLVAVRPTIALDAIPGVWRGTRTIAATPTEPTGFRPLDEAILGGWPQGSLSQIVSPLPGFGLSLIVPVLARLTRAGRHVALIQTPYLPYAPALDSRGIDLSRLLWIQPPNQEQAFWATEQLLRSGLVAAVAFWTGRPLDGAVERRLQLAAETGRCLVFAFRVGEAEGPSYAALKLALRPVADGRITVDVLKCRGSSRGSHQLTHAFTYRPTPSGAPNAQ